MVREVIAQRARRAGTAGLVRAMPARPSEYHVEVDADGIYADASLECSILIERSDDGINWRHAASATKRGGVPRGMTATGGIAGNPTIRVDNPGGVRFRTSVTFNKAVTCRVLDEVGEIPQARNARPPQSIGLQQAITTGGGSYVDTLDVSYGSATQASGSALACAVAGWRGSGSGGFLLTDITDNKSNDWIKAGEGGISVSGDVNAMGFYVANAAGGSTHTVSFNPTGSNHSLDVALYELSGAATTSLLGGTAGSNNNNATSISTGNLSAAGADGDIEIAVVCATSTGTKTVGSLTPAYTEVAEGTDGANDRVYEFNYRILTGATSDGASWSQASGSRWSGFAFVLAAAAAGGGGGQPTTKRFGGVPFMGGHGAGFPSVVQRW